MVEYRAHARVPAFGKSSREREVLPANSSGQGPSLEKDEVWWVAIWVKALVVMVAFSIALMALEQAFGWVGKVLHLLATTLKYAIKFLLS